MGSGLRRPSKAYLGLALSRRARAESATFRTLQAASTNINGPLASTLNVIPHAFWLLCDFVVS